MLRVPLDRSPETPLREFRIPVQAGEGSGVIADCVGIRKCLKRSPIPFDAVGAPGRPDGPCAGDAAPQAPQGEGNIGSPIWSKWSSR